MEFLKSLFYFLATGRSRNESEEDRRERLRKEAFGEAGPPASGWVQLFMAFVAIAVIVKLVIDALGGQSLDLSIRGLVQSYGVFLLILMAVVAIIVLRNLFAWRADESQPGGGGGCSVIVLVIVAVIGGVTWYVRGNGDSSSARDIAAGKTPPEVEHRVPPAETPTVAAPASVPAAEDPEALANARRASLEQRWRSARSIAVEKWRADMLTANALGEIGAVPPMLAVHSTSAQVEITNRGPAPACVQLARVTRPKTDAVQRCQVGPLTCLTVKPGATLRLPVSRNGARESCLNAVLEFRVGNVDFPEPSWWSRTAFNEFTDPPMDIDYKDEADLQADIARFEATVEDQDRAARWRRDLASPAP